MLDKRSPHKVPASGIAPSRWSEVCLKEATTTKVPPRVTLSRVLIVPNLKVRQATLNNLQVIHQDMHLGSNNLRPAKADLRHSSSSHRKVRTVDDPCNRGGMRPILARDSDNNLLPCSPSTEATRRSNCSHSDLEDLLVSTHLALEVHNKADRRPKRETRTWHKLDRGSHCRSGALHRLSHDSPRSPRWIRGDIQVFLVICRQSFDVSHREVMFAMGQ